MSAFAERATAASDDGIYKEGTLWAACIHDMRQRNNQGRWWRPILQSRHLNSTDTQQDGTLYFVGSKGSGKSTIIDRFLGKPVRC